MRTEKNNLAKEVTAVVCSWNDADIVEKCLKSLKKNDVGELILVDANSNDGTREIGKKYADKILTDPGHGTGTARNIGASHASKKYVLHVGIDNVIPKGNISRMVRYLENGGYSGVSAMTYLEPPLNGYLSWSLDLYKKARYYPGERDVIGSPMLFTTKFAKNYPFDVKMTCSDDGDLCDRLRSKGHRFAIANTFVYEIGRDSIRTTFTRFKAYGKSDWEIFTKHSPIWNLRRKFYSFTHPFRNDLLYPIIRVSGIKRFFILPFLLLITSIRYFYWMHYFFRKRTNLGA